MASFLMGPPPTAPLAYWVSAGLLPTMQTSPLPQQPIIFLLDKFIGMFFCILCRKWGRGGEKGLPCSFYPLPTSILGPHSTCVCPIPFR